ncbi:MAG TPA: M48 family metallopeptidase [Gemmatimonadaceae bacterium]|nr:M48 family metallopeptidase [Gemmatimonadaceae bacterium]
MADDTPTNLFAQQEANLRRSRWLVAGFVLFFAWLGFGGDWLAYEFTRAAPPREYHHLFPWFGLLLSAIGAGLAAWTWKTGPERVLWSAGAFEVLDPADPAQRQYVNVVEEMAIAAGLPRPRIWLIPDADPNALATGRDPASAHIAVTEGLLRVCTRDELQAVVAHELGHVKNFDVRLMTLLAGLVGAIALVSDGVGRTIFRGGVRVGGGGGGGGSGGGGSRGGKRGGDLGPVVFVLLALWLISWILAPLITRLLALGVSRKREYLADAMGAQFTRNPLALASALEKIERSEAPTTSIKGGAAHLCICDPLGRAASLREGRLADLLGTHPPMAMRVARLKAMGYQEQKRAGTFVVAGER